MGNAKMTEVADAMLSWYDENGRDLPWRIKGAPHHDPYHVWLSEIMLQQTTVVTVKPYFEKFIQLWPTVKDMACAPLDDILTQWAGLGYYARARNLHKCAEEVCRKWGGEFPATEEDLLSLPGIGPYTAAAIAAIAFDEAAVVIDGNIERIVTRLYRFDGTLPAARPDIKALAAQHTPNNRPGDYAQSLMDLGSRICKPKKPLCHECPIQVNCAAFEAGDMEQFPKKAPKKVKPTRRAPVFWIENERGEVLLRRREETGLLGGMMEFPSADWVEREDKADILSEVAEILAEDVGLVNELKSAKTVTPIKHTFTHFHLYLHPYIIRAETEFGGNWAVWARPEDFRDYALPTLMTKVAKKVAEGQEVLPL
ncbi:MAG: A/G-specific adenine glycosylase [Sneathiella sp.]|nr:A/G-specific adenine glycosylase [Sneathiella sp.]